jgi:serine/threonine protein kinase
MDISPSRPPDGNLLARGATIGRFQVIALVGKGGMGEVYAAYDPELDRNVAIKLLRAGKNSDSDEGRARMMREAQATARVSHPNVVIVYDAGTFQDRARAAGRRCWRSSPPRAAGWRRRTSAIWFTATSSPTTS